MKSKTKKPKFKKLKEFHIRKGLYPLRVILSVWDDGKAKPHIELYSGAPAKKGPYKHNSFKIRDKRIWERIKRIIDTHLIKALSEGKQLSEKAIEKEVEKEIEILKKDNRKLNQTVKAYSQLLKHHREKKIPDYQDDLQRLEKLMKKSKKESELQKFLSKKPWLLGLEYENTTPQKISVGQRYDFYLEKYDGFADIVEIKKVSDNVFDKKDRITAVFGKAIQQLIEYIDDAIHWGNDKKLSEKLKLNFLKPKGILVIGQKQDPKKLQNLAYYFHNIEILTYDDILERGKNILKHIKSGSKKK